MWNIGCWAKHFFEESRQIECSGSTSITYIVDCSYCFCLEVGKQHIGVEDTSSKFNKCMILSLRHSLLMQSVGCSQLAMDVFTSAIILEGSWGVFSFLIWVDVGNFMRPVMVMTSKISYLMRNWNFHKGNKILERDESFALLLRKIQPGKSWVSWVKVRT